MSESPIAKRPESCEYQIVRPGRQIPVIGGSAIVRDSYICHVKALKDGAGNAIMTLGIGCDFVGNEGNCPLRAEARQRGERVP